MGEGYNPYRKENGEFATKAGAKCESDLNDAIESGDIELQAKIKEVIMTGFAETDLSQKILAEEHGAEAMKGKKKEPEKTPEQLEAEENFYSDQKTLRIEAIDSGHLSDERVNEMSHDENRNVRVAAIKSGQLSNARVEELSYDDSSMIRENSILSDQISNKRVKELSYDEDDMIRYAAYMSRRLPIKRMTEMEKEKKKNFIRKTITTKILFVVFSLKIVTFL